MQDSSIWGQPTVLANNVWQTAAFPVKEGSSAPAEWGPPGVFDLDKIASWGSSAKQTTGREHKIRVNLFSTVQ